jgi:hypothetical protein
MAGGSCCFGREGRKKHACVAGRGAHLFEAATAHDRAIVKLHASLAQQVSVEGDSTASEEA